MSALDRESTGGRSRSRPMISVLMLTYNRPIWLAEAVESVLRSRCDLELLICDNGSTWATGEVLKRYAGNHRVRCFRMERNDIQGAVAFLASQAQGEYAIWFPDDDVIADPDWLADACKMLDEHPEAGLCWSYIEQMEDGKPTGEVRGQRFTRPMTFEDEFPANAIPMSACVFRAKYLHYPRLGLRFFGEMDLWLQILHESVGIPIPRVTTWVRLHWGTESILGYYSNGFMDAHLRVWEHWIQRGFKPSEDTIKDMIQVWAGVAVPAKGADEWNARFMGLFVPEAA